MRSHISTVEEPCIVCLQSYESLLKGRVIFRINAQMSSPDVLKKLTNNLFTNKKQVCSKFSWGNYFHVKWFYCSTNLTQFAYPVYNENIVLKFNDGISFFFLFYRV